MTVEPIEMIQAATTPPEVGRKIIAFLSDGSGARIFIVRADGFYEADGDDQPTLGGCDRYAYLPNDFETWTERHNGY